MWNGKKTSVRSPRLEILEGRLLLSVTKHPVKPTASQQKTFVANLTPGAVVLPLDFSNAQIEGGGGAAAYALPGLDDPARGKVTLTIHGNEIKVAGALSHISNVSAITIHDLKYPAVFPLRGSTTSPATQPPALSPDTPVLPADTVTTISATTTKPPKSTPTPPMVVNTAQTVYATPTASIPASITTTTNTTATTEQSVTNPDSSVSSTVNTTSFVTASVTGMAPPANITSGPLYYASTTINSATLTAQTDSQPGQIPAKNIGQNVELLLNPGNGGGPLPTAATFQTVIRPQYLLGPLSTRKGFAQFMQDLKDGLLYVLVQTNNGYDAATGAVVDGNFPNGELRGKLQ